MSTLCVFAHPDDEAFGPGGTIAQLSKEHEVYLLCVTNGEAGQKGEFEAENLGEIRREELLRSAEILGIKKVFFLNYGDGTLCNSLYHEIADKIEGYVKRLQPKTLLTFEPRGVSGHLDHIAVSFITTYVFEKSPPVKKLMYYCLGEKERAFIPDYFVYFPPGYERKDIDEVVDISGVWDQKVAAMRSHVSQNNDVQRILSVQKELPKKEYFLVRHR